MVDPILPCLTERAWSGGGSSTVSRPLWDGETSAHMPWVAFGYDRPHTFEFLASEQLPGMGKSAAQIEREALRNLERRKTMWQSLDVKLGWFKKLRLLICGDDFLAAEKILSPSFLMEAQRTLKARGLLVVVPRRGLLVAMDGEAATADVKKATAFLAFVSGQYHDRESAPISPAAFVVKDGKVMGVIDVAADAGKSNEDEHDADGSAPHTMLVKDDAGREQLHILAGGDDFEKLAYGVITALAGGLSQQAGRAEFSGNVKVVILAHTPPEVRAQLPRLEEHLQGLAAETNAKAAKPIRIEVEQQGDTPK